MDLGDVKRVMRSKEPVLWSGNWYIVIGCTMKLTEKNKQAPTAPFYYTLLLLDAKSRNSTVEVLIGDVKMKRSESNG